MKAGDYVNPAHPEQSPQSKAMGEEAPRATYGLTARDFIAIEAMKGYLSNVLVMYQAIGGWEEKGGDRPTCVADWIAGLAYEMADSMIEESNK